MTRTAVLQSNYLPWKGYFDIIHDVDVFIFYDDVQYTKNDWRNRNKVKTAHGTTWLTIPTGPNLNRLICDVELQDAAWQTKHWNTISQTYARAPFFPRYRRFFEAVYLDRRWTNLSTLNQYLVKTISRDLLGIPTEFGDSRDFAVVGAKQDRLIDLCRKARATYYLSGPAAKDYIDPQAFEAAGIELAWKSYEGYPEHPQLFPPFEHAVSIIDLLFNTGPDAPDYIWNWREK
jgi:hypothetical protein